MLKLKGFRILKTLEQRSDMTVALALQESLDRKVFLKILPPELKAHPDILDQFEQEARALARLDHPNIITIHTFSRTGDNPYIVLEYFEGRDLQAFRRDKGSVSETELTAIMKQCLEGLKHAHEAGVLHRDLKPQNILINSAGVVKLTDFGLSSLVGEGKPGQNISGSPGYFAPEAALGDPANEASDIFSMGMVFYELACGTNPLKAENLVEALNRSVTHIPPPLEACTTFSPQLTTIIQKMIEKSPADRYRNCEQILEDLNTSTIKRENVPSPTAPVPTPGKRPSMRPAIWIGLVVLTGSLILLIPDREKADKPPAAGIESLMNREEKPSVTEPQELPALVSDTKAEIAKVPETAAAVEAPVMITPPAAPKSVPLTIVALPWATVRVDSQEIGTTPLEHPVRLTAGDHIISFEHSDFPPYAMTYTVVDSGDTLVFRWRDIYGFVALKVNPWADVYIDGQFIDATPLGNPVPLTTGGHHIILKNPDYPLWQKYIELAAGDTVTLTVKLSG